MSPDFHDTGNGADPSCRLRNSWLAGLVFVSLWLVSFQGVAVFAEKEDPPGESRDDGAPAEIAHEEPVSLEGQVTDQLGVGHADVSVILYRRNADGSRGDKLADTRTDRLGDFTIRAKERIRGPILVVITGRGFAELTRPLNIDPDEEPPFLPEELRGNLVLSGRVLEVLKDGPISRASVLIDTGYRQWTATTDEQGRFSIEGWSNAAGSLSVDAPGFGREVCPFLPDPSRDDADAPSDDRLARVRLRKPAQPSDAVTVDGGQFVVRLRPQRVIRLKLIDDLGAPIPNVMVEFLDQPRNDFRTLVSDKNGAVLLERIHFDALSPTFRLTHPEHVSSGDFDRELKLDPDRPESSHELVMVRAGRVSGRLLDAATRRPLNGGRVMVGATGSESSPRDWSDDDGSFTILGVAPGPAVVTVHLAEHAPDLSVVEVRPAETASVEFLLVPPRDVKGSVKWKSGDPLSGAMVQADLWRGHKTLGLRAITDDDGQFILRGAPPDAFDLVVYARGSAATRVRVELGSTPIEITVERSSATDTPTIKSGAAAPELSLTTLDGETLSLPSKDSAVIVLDFWATWCGPCIAEIPTLKNVYEKFASRKDFRLVSVSLDDDEKSLRAFIKDRRMNWTHVFGESARAAAEKFGVVGIPSLFVISADHRVIAADIPAGELERELARTFRKSEAPPAENRK